MRTTTIAKTVLGIGSALLVLAVGPAAMAYASTDDRGPGDRAVNVPCSGSEGGAAGLIEAIDTANAGGGGTINLARGCTYKLTSVNNTNTMPMIGGKNGLPVVTSRITINGSGKQTGDQVKASEAEGTTIAGNGHDFRVFEVDGPGGNLTLQGLTITGGFSSVGGGIFNAEGAVTLNHSQVTGNTASFAGGGIASGNVKHPGPIGTAILNYSQVNANTTLGIPPVGGPPGGGGGGILNHGGTLTLNHSQVNANTSAGGGGGIVSGTGGGVVSSSMLTLNFSQVYNNTANGGPFSGGGGIANSGMATITHSQVHNNRAPGGNGGGIFNHGTMTINISEVNGNQAPMDASGNQGAGGGIAHVDFGVGAVLTINRSQVNDNSASGVGGGIVDFGGPGGPLALDHSQVTGNSSDSTSASGGGIYAIPGSVVTLTHTSVRKNTPDNCFPPGTIAGCSG